jgi:CO/xanthine dehydrogenase Mo-binding subunit
VIKLSTTIKQNIHRKEAWDKVTGKAKYTDDLPVTNYLCARLLTSKHAYAKIKKIDTFKALELKGVKSIITGYEFPILTGPLLADRSPLARDIVRYVGEPIAIVVAIDEATALKAVRLIEVDYDIYTPILSVIEALDKNAPLLHPNINKYKRVMDDINPIKNSNISAKFQMRKGNIEKGFAESDVIIEQTFSLPQSDHLAMEIRSVRAEISVDGKVKIETSSQSPYSVKKQLASYFNIEEGNIEVHVPFVGGAFGGKAPVTLEFLAYIASHKVDGNPVRLITTREEDMISAPSRLGLEAKIKLGATYDGKINAASLIFYLDSGAYVDISPYMSKSIAADCTGPYNIENLHCDSFCVYTNHTYSTSYRGFGHLCYTYCMERAFDILANKCGLDPLKFRFINAIKPGNLTPSQGISTYSNTGDITMCLNKLRNALNYDGIAIKKIDDNIVRSIGISCFWKAAHPPTNAISGAIVTFNSDGSLNLNTGVVEMGSGGQTNLAQMLADKLKMDISQIHVVLDVDTRLNPEHFKTVASITNFMAGNAVMTAANDIIAQLKCMGAQIFSCDINDIEIENSKVFHKDNPKDFIPFKKIVHGYKTNKGSSLGEPIIAKGPFMLKGLTLLDPNTGKGKSEPSWTVGAQAVEIEFNKKDYSYRILNAYTAIDVGNIINPNGMKEIVIGGMSMGLSLASREVYRYNKNGSLETPNLRTYKLLHIGQEPIYHVNFVETPQTNSPYGTRSISEHGIIGIPAALGNALTLASGVNIIELPITPEYIWKQKEDEQNDI